jgi:hypothetical protein
MTTPPTFDGLNPFDDPVDRILAEIALSLQLPPSLRQQVDGRYEAVRRRLEGTVAFAGAIEHFYPQGSMAIDATISTRGTDDEYDLDIVSQLGGRFRQMQPLAILLELEAALKDYPVQSVRRQTRCVTLDYADNMHFDITPALRGYGTLDRESFITHAKGPAQGVDDRFVDMNAYGFARWYQGQTPIERRLAKAFDEHWRTLDALLAKDAAEVDEIPDATHFLVKNTATLALQLLKRARNIAYEGKAGRIPPSVMLSYYAGLAAQPNMRLTDMVIRIAAWIVRDIAQASLNRQTLHVTNPVKRDDVFTDRWPESIAQQDAYASYLKVVIKGLEEMRDHKLSADAIGEWLRKHFGDRVVTKAADRMARNIGETIQNAGQRYTRTGGLFIPTKGVGVAAVAVLNPAVTARAHTFFGKKI